MVIQLRWNAENIDRKHEVLLSNKSFNTNCLDEFLSIQNYKRFTKIHFII